MKILSIGNSFSQDAQRYLYSVAKANGKVLKNVNLMIGGCSLKRHYINSLEDKSSYSFEFRGENTGISVSIKEALISDDWDYVTLQQVSHQSPDWDSFQPYIEHLAAYIRKYCPKAKILLHQTWGYPDYSARERGYESSADMLDRVKPNYDRAKALIEADDLIRSGEAMLRAYRNVGDSLYRDAIHAGNGFGRYLLALVWYKKLFGQAEEFSHIDEFDRPVSEEEKALAYSIVFGDLSAEE